MQEQEETEKQFVVLFVVNIYQNASQGQYVLTVSLLLFKKVMFLIIMDRVKDSGSLHLMVRCMSLFLLLLFVESIILHHKIYVKWLKETDITQMVGKQNA